MWTAQHFTESSWSKDRQFNQKQLFHLASLPRQTTSHYALHLLIGRRRGNFQLKRGMPWSLFEKINERFRMRMSLFVRQCFHSRCILENRRVSSNFVLSFIERFQFAMLAVTLPLLYRLLASSYRYLAFSLPLHRSLPLHYPSPLYRFLADEFDRIFHFCKTWLQLGVIHHWWFTSRRQFRIFKCLVNGLVL